MNKFLFISLFGFILMPYTSDVFAQDDSRVKNFPFYIVTKETNALNSVRLSERGVPIPPRRPQVMKVSPSYIEELRSRNDETTRHSGQDELQLRDTDSMSDDEGLKNSNDAVPLLEESDLDPQTALSSLLPLPETSLEPDHKDLPEIQAAGTFFDDAPMRPVLPSVISQELKPSINQLPLPPTLPERRLSQISKERLVHSQDKLAMQLSHPGRLEILAALDPNSIAPASGNMNNNETKNQNSEAIISFALKPEQLRIDKAIETFLRDHALDMFKKNKSLKMEIQSYATPIDGDVYSPIRISLARALEIRRFLIDKGISPSRLRLKTMTEIDGVSQDDRIDLILIK